MTTDPEKRLHERLLAAALGVSVALGAWLAAEAVVARWVEIPPEPYPPGFGPMGPPNRSLLRYDARLLWRPRPGLTVSEKVADGTSYTVTTNALGLRDDPFPAHPGSWRVLSLGDSNTWGFGVENHQTYTSVLERLLQAAHPQVAVEALNAGVVGYGSAQSLRLEEDLLRDWHFDLVLVYAMGCDRSPASRPDADHLHGPAVTALLDLAQHSGLFRLARRAVYRHGAPVPAGPPRERATLETSRVNLARMVGSAQEHGAEALLVVPLPTCAGGVCASVLAPLHDPSRATTELPAAEVAFHDVVRTVARETGARLVDLPAQVGGWGPTQAIYIDTSHPTVEGHARVAAAIAVEVLPLIDRGRAAASPDGPP